MFKTPLPWLFLAFAFILPANLDVALAADQPAGPNMISLDGTWSLAIDPKNVGREEKWFEKTPDQAKPTRVPGTIQEVFPLYHGVAWCWREFTPPANPHAGGRYLLKFWNVDYLGDVWVNGVYAGQHEGASEPFVLDVTDAVKPGAVNKICVRVLNAANEPIDGIKLSETAHTAKTQPWSPGRIGNWGGITDSVELIAAPVVRVEDLFVRADPKTGQIRIRTNLRNAGEQAAQSEIAWLVAPAAGGEAIDQRSIHRELPPGDTTVESMLEVKNPRLWELNDPYLYRVTASVATAGSPRSDVNSARCGFRDFRLENGYFRLNGKRIFVKSSHSGSEVPVGMNVPLDPDLLRKDLLNCKVMGFNMFRSFNGLCSRYQLDLCDEIGLLVYQENYASWFMEDSPKMAERLDRACLAMVRRDRNHPSIAVWGLLNEMPAGPVVNRAAALLPKLRELDDTRGIFLNSGNWDGSAGTYANPGETQWQSILADQHPYQAVPHTAAVVNTLRTVNGGNKPLWLSEYGVGSAVDLVRLARHYEQIGMTSCEDALAYRGFLDQFLNDWNRWNLADTFANPEDYFRQCLAWMAGLRLLGIDAIRANPNVIGYSLTGTQDQGMSGEGATATLFRELKPGAVDAVFNAFYPLHWCLFVEPTQIFRGNKICVEAVLINEDVLAPGDYPVRFQIVGPGNISILDRTVAVNVPGRQGDREPPFAIAAFKEEVPVDGPSGKYRFLATFQKGGAATAGDAEFYVADPADMPKVETQVILWGDDPDVAQWLAAQGIQTRPFTPGAQNAREVILVGCRPAAGDAEAFRELARHIARGSNVVFLSPEIFQKGDDPLGWLPLVQKGTMASLPTWLYHKDDWAKHHAIFDGMPAGCVLEHTYYRDILRGTPADFNPRIAFSGQETPAEVVAGSINTSIGYGSGLTVAVYQLGEGRFTLNALRIRENLGKNPAADRLLRNMLRHAAVGAEKPPAELPSDFDNHLKSLGY